MHVELTEVGELGSDGKTGNHGDVLVGGAHYLRDHSVLKEEGSKDHTTGDTSRTTKDGSDEAEEGQLDDLTSVFESGVT